MGRSLLNRVSGKHSTNQKLCRLDLAEMITAEMKGPIIPCVRTNNSREHDWMSETAKRTEPQSGDAPVDAGEAAVAETVEPGSSVGAIASKVSGSHTPGNESSEKRTTATRSEQSKPNVDAYAKRRFEIKKKKKAAHCRRLKASHTKG